MVNYKECMDYAENYLKTSGGDHGPRYPFRSRSSHTKRVVLWAKRLCEQRTDVNEEVLITSAIFHDVGYIFKRNKDNSLGSMTEYCDMHAASGAEIFQKYAAEHNFDFEFTDKVAHCIETHSSKYLLKEPEKITIEQILLMEAYLRSKRTVRRQMELESDGYRESKEILGTEAKLC